MDGSVVFARCTPSNTWLFLWAHPSPAIFAQLMTQHPYTLQRAATFPLKISPSHWGIWIPI